MSANKPAGCPIPCCKAGGHNRAACNARAVGEQRGGLGEAEHKAQVGFGSVKWSVEPCTKPAELFSSGGCIEAKARSQPAVCCVGIQPARSIEVLSPGELLCCCWLLKQWLCGPAASIHPSIHQQGPLLPFPAPRAAELGGGNPFPPWQSPGHTDAKPLCHYEFGSVTAGLAEEQSLLLFGRQNAPSYGQSSAVQCRRWQCGCWSRRVWPCS